MEICNTKTEKAAQLILIKDTFLPFKTKTKDSSYPAHQPSVISDAIICLHH